MAANQSVTLFISYAHRDEELKTQLDKHLTPLKLQKVIDKWSDRQIEGGQDWAHQIDSNLKSADIILLLVSPDFVSSEYCAGIELREAMTRYHRGDAVVVPVILEPCDWKWLDFGKLQATPKDGKAITDWANINSAFLDVTNTIRQIAQGLLDQRQKKLEEKQAAAARYKSKVEEVLSDGEITPLERKTLNELRDLLGLTAEEAEAIKDSAYQPLREYQSKLVQYRVDLMETIQADYPLSERTIADLKQRQRELGLKVEDADRLEVELLADAEARHQAHLKAAEAALQHARDEAVQRGAERVQREAREAAEQRLAEQAELAERAANEAGQRAAEQAQREARDAAQRDADNAQRRAEAVAAERAQAQARQRADAAALRPAEAVTAAVHLPPPPAAPALVGAEMRTAQPSGATLAPPQRPSISASDERPAAAQAAPPAASVPSSPSRSGSHRLPGAAIGGGVCVVLAGLVNMEYVAFIPSVQLFVALAALSGAMAGAISRRGLWFAIPAVTVGAIFFRNYSFGAGYLLLALAVVAALVVKRLWPSTAQP